MTDSRYPKQPIAYETSKETPAPATSEIKPETKTESSAPTDRRRPIKKTFSMFSFGVLLFSITSFLVAISGKALVSASISRDLSDIFLFLSYLAVLLLVGVFSGKSLMASLGNTDGDIIRQQFLKQENGDSEEIQKRIQILLKSVDIKPDPIDCSVVAWADRSLSKIDARVSEVIASEAVSAGTLAAISRNKWLDLVFVGRSCYRSLEEIARLYGVRPSMVLFFQALSCSLLSSAFNDVGELIEIASRKVFEALPFKAGDVVGIINRFLAEYYVNFKLVSAFSLVAADMCRPIPFEEKAFRSFERSINQRMSEVSERISSQLVNMLSHYNPFSSETK